MLDLVLPGDNDPSASTWLRATATACPCWPWRCLCVRKALLCVVFELYRTQPDMTWYQSATTDTPRLVLAPSPSRTGRGTEGATALSGPGHEREEAERVRNLQWPVMLVDWPDNETIDCRGVSGGTVGGVRGSECRGRGMIESGWAE